MLNIENVRALYSVPKTSGITKKIAKVKKKSPLVKESTLKLVISEINKNKGITRQRLKDRADLSFSCLNRCFKELLERKIAYRVAIKNAGAYKVYAYYLIEDVKS